MSTQIYKSNEHVNGSLETTNLSAHENGVFQKAWKFHAHESKDFTVTVIFCLNTSLVHRFSTSDKTLFYLYVLVFNFQFVLVCFFIELLTVTLGCILCASLLGYICFYCLPLYKSIRYVYKTSACVLD